MNILKAGQEENAIECFIKVFLEVKDFIEDDFIKKEVPWYISNLRFRSEIFYNGQPLVSSFIYKVYDGQIFNDYIKQLYKSSSSVIKMQRTIRGYLERKKIQKKSITEAKIQSPRFMVIQETAKDIDTGHVRRPFFPDQTKITDEDLRPYQTTITSEDFCPDQTTTTSRDTRFGLLSLYLEGKIKINKDIFDQILIHFNIHNPPIHFSYFPGGFSMQDVERKLFSDSESFKYIVSFLMKKSKYLIVFDKIRRFISQESGSTNLSIRSQQNCYCIYLDKYFHRDWMAQRLEEKKIYSSLLIAHPLASPCIVRRIACIFFEKDINLYIHKLKNNLYGIYYINEGIPCYVPEKYTLEEIKGLTKLLENEQGPIISP